MLAYIPVNVVGATAPINIPNTPLLGTKVLKVNVVVEHDFSLMFGIGVAVDVLFSG